MRAESQVIQLIQLFDIHPEVTKQKSPERSPRHIALRQTFVIIWLVWSPDTRSYRIAVVRISNTYAFSSRDGRPIDSYPQHCCTVIAWAIGDNKGRPKAKNVSFHVILIRLKIIVNIEWTHLSTPHVCSLSVIGFNFYTDERFCSLVLYAHCTRERMFEIILVFVSRWHFTRAFSQNFW